MAWGTEIDLLLPCSMNFGPYSARHQSQRGKKRPNFCPMHEQDRQFWPLSANQAALVDALVQHCAGDFYLVGGYVRDVLMNRSDCFDLDLAHGHGEPMQCGEIARQLGWKVFALDKDRGNWRFLWKKGTVSTEVVDIAPLQGSSITDDLALRDCSVNAMAVHIAAANGLGVIGRLLDPHGGQRDLKRGTLRPISWANLRDDPLRMLRLLRLSLTHELQMQAGVLAQIRAQNSALRDASGERVREEGWRILLQSRLPFSQAVELLLEAGLSELSFCCPVPGFPKILDNKLPYSAAAFLEGVGQTRFDRSEIVHGFPGASIPPKAWSQITQAADESLAGDYTRVNWWSRLALQALPLMSRACIWTDHGQFDQGAYQSALPTYWENLETHLKHLAFSKLEVRHCMNVQRCLCQMLVALQSGQMECMGPRELHRLIINSGYTCEVSILMDTMFLLGLALQASENNTDLLLCRYQNWQGRALTMLVGSNFRKPQPLASGTDLQDWFQLSPGPRVGQLLDQLLEAEACKRISTKKEARSYLATLL